MKSGLEGRNNVLEGNRRVSALKGLNEVRPRRPEQSQNNPHNTPTIPEVSMKSGLEGRNNEYLEKQGIWSIVRLNEVRPRRPEQ